MRTAYCPKSHTELARESAGNEYGHVPGHQYHDVDVVISRRGDKYRCHVVESWGSCQGYDEEHGRREAIGRGESIRECVVDARGRAADAGIVCEYREQALSLAEDAATEAETDAPAQEALTALDALQAAIQAMDGQTPEQSEARADALSYLPLIRRCLTDAND